MTQPAACTDPPQLDCAHFSWRQGNLLWKLITIFPVYRSIRFPLNFAKSLDVQKKIFSLCTFVFHAIARPPEFLSRSFLTRSNQISYSNEWLLRDIIFSLHALTPDVYVTCMWYFFLRTPLFFCLSLVEVTSFSKISPQLPPKCYICLNNNTSKNLDVPGPAGIYYALNSIISLTQM